MAEPRRAPGWRRALADLAGAFVPLRVQALDREIGDRLRKIPTRLNEFGFDPYGFHPHDARPALLLAACLYRWYFRVQVHDVERVPAGPVLLIANHAGQLPFDGMMLGLCMLLEAQPPRIVRPMGEYWIPRLPFVSVAAARVGAMVGTPENCVAMLERGECVMVFPEGVRGINKPWSKAYQLQRFGLGFMRLALETGTPIVPVAVVGSEEQQPGLTELPRLAKLLGLPAFPVTLGFPWLGPLGILPLPVKYHIHFGAPLRFEGDPNDDDAVVEDKVQEVRLAIARMLERGRSERRGIFSG